MALVVLTVESGAGDVEGPLGTALSGPYEDPNQAQVPFGRWSVFRQPWRAYMDTWPWPRLTDCLGINFKNAAGNDDHVAPIYQLLAECGFRHVRVEIGWNLVDYNNPTTLRASEVARLTPYLQAFQANGLRPMILLNSHHGDPCPNISFTVTTAAASIGATSLTLSGANTSQIRPGYTGLIQSGKKGFPLITSFSGGVAQLSAPLAAAVGAGSLTLYDLKFHPFSGPTLSGGVNNPFCIETHNGWVDYVKAVRDFCVAALGTGSNPTDKGFDLEVWNELTFGSSFLRERDYYDPDRTYDVDVLHYENFDPPLVPDVNGVSIINVIWAQSVDWVKDPANDCPGVKIMNGFSNQRPWDSGGNLWPTADGFSRHYYTGLTVDPLPTNGTWLSNQPAVLADGTLEGPPGWVPNNLLRSNAEYRYIAYQTEHHARDTLPFPDPQFGHGRYVYRAGYPGLSKIAETWMTETNTHRKPKREAIAAAAGVSGTDPQLMALMEDTLGAKCVLRNFFFQSHKGLGRLYLFADNTNQFDFNFLPDNLYDVLTAQNFQLNATSRAAVGNQYTVLKRAVDALAAGADTTLTVARKVTVDGLWEQSPRKSWSGDGTAEHPDRWHRQDFACLPYQVTASKFAVAYYVVTVNAAATYDTSKGHLDPLRYEFPEQTFDITLSNVRGLGASLSIYDPITDTTTPAQAYERTATTLGVRVPAKDYPRILLIAEDAVGPLIKDVTFEIINDVPRLTFTTNVAAAPIISWGTKPDRTSGGSTTLPSGTSHSIDLTGMAYTDAVKIDVAVNGLSARWPIWGHDVAGEWQYLAPAP